MMKKVILWAMILLVVVCGAMYLYLDVIVTLGVRQGLNTNGIKGDVERVSVNPLEGKITLSELTISNPDGFSKSSLLSLSQAKAQVDYSTVLKEQIIFPELQLTGLQFLMERSGSKFNTSAFEGKSEEDDASVDSQKEIIIQKVVIKDVRIAMDLGDGKQHSVKLPEITFENVSSKAGVKGIVSRLVKMTVKNLINRMQHDYKDVLKDAVIETVKDDFHRLQDKVKDKLKKLF
jgi:uncharacterized protein involved in outer membrane biogenesis